MQRYFIKNIFLWMLVSHDYNIIRKQNQFLKYKNSKMFAL